MSLIRRAAVVAALGSFAFSGMLVAQRWYRRWGATNEENAEPLPGDGGVTRPMVAHTNAITIDAAPEDVWPWIVQLGTGRGGWYSYDLIERTMGLAVKSLDRIEPKLQLLHEGDEIPLAPDVVVPVKRIEPPELLLLEGHDPKLGDATWLFVLRETDDGATRLITRARVRWPLSGIARVAFAALEFGVFLMQRKMLLGIRERAEALARERMPVVEPALEEKVVPTPDEVREAPLPREPVAFV